LVFVQITRTIPLRRTILQFSQILLTLLRTFMTFSLAVFGSSNRRIVNSIKKQIKAQALREAPNQKPEIRVKSATRNPKKAHQTPSLLRISGFGFSSDFRFRASDFRR